MSDPSVSKSRNADVLAAYDEQAHDWGKSVDPRDQHTYMISKLKSDYALVDYVGCDDKSVLNLGCSFPVDEMHYARKIRSWVSIDLSIESIKAAERILREELNPEQSEKFSFLGADMCELPFRDASFDLTLSMSTIDHLPTEWSRQRSIDEMARTTKPGGHVIVTAANRWNVPYAAGIRKMTKEKTLHYGYAYLFSPTELRNMGLKAGLRPIHFAASIAPPEVWLPGYPSIVRWPAVGAFKLARLAGYFGRRVGYAFVKDA